jgi:acetate---CoA ligase (ADP-forming)
VTGVAVVGASERTLWTYWLLKNLDSYGYGDRLWPVNPARTEVFGRPCYHDLDDVPGIPEIGVIVVRPELAVSACQRLVDLGARTVIVVSNGFKETGTELGLRAEEDLVRICEGAGVRLIGPNCVGYASLHDGVCAIAEPVPPQLTAGDVTVMSHSGAMLSGVLGALEGENLGVDQVYSIGNGASFDMAAALAAGTGAAATKVVCAVIEGIPPRRKVEEIVAAGQAEGKEYVFLLLGQSAGGRKVAQSHTGAVIGEQSIARAWLHSIGVTVTNSVEELARVASLVRAVGRPPRERGLFVITASGGGAGLASDLADRHGVPLAQVSEATRRLIEAALPAGGYAGNPLDMVAGIDQQAREVMIKAVCEDPAVGILLEPYTITWPDGSDGRHWHREGFEDLARQVGSSGIPGIVSSIFEEPLTPWMQEYRERTGMVVTGGVSTTMAALGRLYGWDGSSRRPQASSPDAGTPKAAGAVIGEGAGRELLVQSGLPVVPGEVVANGRSAAARAARDPGPWVLKLGLAGVAHKGRVGGVRVGLWGQEAVRNAAEAIAASAVGAGLADDPDQVPLLLQEMHLGPEILLGAVRDHIAGPSLTVGLGGWAAEAVVPFGVVSLPVSDADLATEIASWGLGRLLGQDKEAQLIGFATDLSRQVVDGTLSSYSVVEINPLILGPRGPVAADVLIVA